RDLAMIGLDRVAGWFGSEAFTAWSAAGGTFASIEQVDAATLAEWTRDRAATIVDVRAADEWAQGHIPGARHAPLGRLPESLPHLAGAERVVMQCQGGSRSAIAASLARRHGVTAVANLRGGFAAWQGAGHPVETTPSGATAGAP
ncbi:MAG TPA: rhodanese-like domain-containing protein, partial [Gemmatimonadaceae bacterium]|nr:rhodanese-like domain-containing protein [Gemmatimonadaceae bacterium]